MPRQTIDDMLFENRNREYGSYQLRKKFHVRLAIGFISSLLFLLIIFLGYFWYLSEAGDEKVYSYSSSSPYLKSTTVNPMSPEELASYMGAATKPREADVFVPEMKKIDPVPSFQVTENVDDEIIRSLDELVSYEPDMDDSGLLINDSTAFGGIPGGAGLGGGGVFDRIPEFPGGATRYVEMNLHYPATAIRQKIHGTVIVTFVINKTGHVTDVKVERGVNPIIDEAAVNTIKNMPPWRPGMMHGKPINFLFRMPINFVPIS